MRKWDSEIFANNHIRLMKCHIGMAVFYCCLCLLVVSLSDRTVSSASMFVTIGFFFLPVLLHLALSYGSYKRIELSRKTSEIVFGLLILVFPIGTLLSMFLFLPATTWKDPEGTKT